MLTKKESSIREIYHAGELAVQARTGVQVMAQRVKRAINTMISPMAQDFLHQQPVVVVASVDAKGWAWGSVLTGPPGFMVANDERTLHIGAAPIESDPLHDNLRANIDVGLLIIDFATRRRLRVNGRAERQQDGSFYVHAQQVYTNCPKYIQARRVELIPRAEQTTPDVHRTDRLTARQHRSRQPWQPHRWSRPRSLTFLVRLRQAPSAAPEPEAGKPDCARGPGGG